MNLKAWFFLLIILTAQTYSQSSNPNLDFESGTFNNWVGGTGTCCPINLTALGIISGRHTIMSGNATDPNTCNVVHVVAPDGLYSARLGNDLGGSEAETLSYSINVTPDTALFIYKYALVLQDPGHVEEEQPRFQVTVLDAAGNLIDPTCGEFTVIAGTGLPGFQTCSHTDTDVIYKDWTAVGLDLTPYMGQTLSIQFATGDCTPGGHFAYAYIDAYCSPLRIGSSFCLGATKAKLTAPIGFEYIWSNGETTQSIIVDNPVAGTTYSCTLISPTGCNVTISTTMELENPIADFTISNTCSDRAIFHDTTIVNNPYLLDGFIWDFGDGVMGSGRNPVHTFPGAGTYTVKFTAFNAYGCSTTATKSITVYTPSTANIAYDSTVFCSADSSTRSVSLNGTGDYTGGVFSSTPGLSLNPATGAIKPSASIPGVYVVTYSIPNSNSCSVPSVSTTIEVSLTPKALINYASPSYCTSVNTPQYSNLTGDGFIVFGTYTATPAGLSINAYTGQIRPDLSLVGDYTITYKVPLSAGVCEPIDAVTHVSIVLGAAATMSYATPLCSSLTTPQAVTLTITGGTAGVGTYTSSPPGLELNGITGAVIPSLSTPGNYIVQAVIPASGACSLLTLNANVSITAVPTATISYTDPFCGSITAPQPAVLTGNGGVYTAPTGVSINSTSGEIIPSGSIPGTYQIVYTIPANLGCSAVSASDTVTIVAPPQPTFSNSAICQDPKGAIFRPAILNTGLSDSLYSCQWFFNASPVPGITANEYTTFVEGDYSVLITDLTTGCISPSITTAVTTAVTVDDFTTYITNTFADNSTLNVIVTGGTGPYLYKIDDQPFQASNTFTGLMPGTHTISITDVNNCTNASKSVMIFGYPKYFTPNGDGKNDFWNINYSDINQKTKVSIYDRFGKLITQLNAQTHGWDGTYNGKMMPSDDYWFLIEFQDYNEKKELIWQTFKSHFSMVR